MPFLMSKDWMIAAIIISAIFIVSTILTAFISDGKTTIEDNTIEVSLPKRIFGALILSAIPIAIITMFSLFLQNKIPYEKVAYFTKVIAVIYIIGLCAIPLLFLAGCCLGCCLSCCLMAKQSAIKKDDTKINIGSLLNDSLNNNDNTLEVSNLNKSNPELNVGVDTSNSNKANDSKVKKEDSTKIIMSSEDLKNLFNNEQANESFVTV